MQGLVLRPQVGECATKGLDLLQRTGVRVESIGPAAHHQTFKPTTETDLALMLRPPALRDPLMALATLLRGR